MPVKRLQALRTLWPKPLIETQHYLNLNFTPSQERETGDIPDRIDSWLQSDSLVHSISRNTADYFDGHLEPVMLGRSMMQMVESWHPAEQERRCPSIIEG